MRSTPFHEGEWLTYYSITEQATDFIRALSTADWTRFCAAARILETSDRIGRPPGGRAERVKGSDVGLFELKITPPGAPGPQLRLLYVRSERRILVARGVIKRSRALPRRDIELAERAVTEHRQREREAKKRRRRG